MKLQKRMVYCKVILLAFLLSFFIGMACFRANAAEIGTSPANNPDLVQGQALFIKARKMYYNAEAANGDLIKLFTADQNLFAQLPDGYDKFYWQSQVAFDLAEMAENSGNKKQAAAGYTKSGDLVRKALRYDAQSSDANRILADTIMRLTTYNGTMYTMSQGPQALKLLNRALSLNQHNYAAMNSIGVYYINAPAIGGGSVDKGIKILQKGLESPDEFDQFIAYVWLGQAYAKKQSSGEAVRNFDQALQIYPNSPWVKDLLQKVQNG
jgi:Uncharacterized protein conserved in bacteria